QGGRCRWGTENLLGQAKSAGARERAVIVRCVSSLCGPSCKDRSTASFSTEVYVMIRHRLGKLSLTRLAALPLSIAMAFGVAVSSSADIMVDLDATGLPEGPLETWSNTG